MNDAPPDSPRHDASRSSLAKLIGGPHLARHLADGVLLVVPSTGALVALNPTAAAIYRGLREAQSPEMIATTLANQFGIPGSRAIADVEAFLANGPPLAAEGTTLADGDSPFRFAACNDAFSVAFEGRVCLEIARDGRTATLSPQIAPALAREALLWVTPKLAVLQGIPVLHASAVRLEGDRAIAFAGQSGAGKSTLARALAAAGGTLLCEDSFAFVLDDPAGAAHMVPFEVTARRWVDEILATAEPGLPASVALPPPDASSGTRIERVLLVDRRRRAGRDLVTAPVGPTTAAGALMVNLFWAALDQEACSRALSWAVSLAARVTVEELTAPAGLDHLTDAARAFASRHGI